MNNYRCHICKGAISAPPAIPVIRDMSHGLAICKNCALQMDSSPVHRTLFRKVLEQEYVRHWIKNVAAELGISFPELNRALALGATNAESEKTAFANTERILGLKRGQLDAAIAVAVGKDWCAT